VRTPLLAAITLHPTGGGIAVVSNLLWQVLVTECGTNARLATAFDHESRPATFAEKARLAIEVGTAQVLQRTDWILFSHLALAQAQHFVPRPLRRPYGVFLHGIEAWTELSPAEKRAVVDADVRIANSQYTAQRVMDTHPDIGCVEACPLALPPAFSNAAQDRNGSSPSTDAIVGLSPRAVLVVGRMSKSERYKGHDQLIEVWPTVVSRVPDAQLVIVGEGDDLSRLKEKAAHTPCAGRIVFCGFVPDATLHTLYDRAALFALPSGGEGFGLVYLEAMAHRLPCVGSTQDAASEIIVNGRTGRLVDQNDIAGLSETVASLLLNESQRRAMGDAGYARATTDFTFDRFSERLRALIQDAEGARQRQSR